jgi:hypothetical protein
MRGPVARQAASFGNVGERGRQDRVDLTVRADSG